MKNLLILVCLLFSVLGYAQSGSFTQAHIRAGSSFRIGVVGSQSVDGIQTTITATNLKLPTSNAVVNYVTGSFSPILTISTGLTRATNTVTSNISTGIAGGQTIYGGTAANDDIVIEGTSHATKTTSAVVLQPGGGNVGVGGNPAYNLDLLGSGTVTLRVYSSDGQSLFRIQGATLGQITNSIGDLYLTNESASGDLIFRAGAAAERMRITGAGNVGIGTTTPTAKLSVTAATGYNQLNLATTYTPTSSADAMGANGDVAYDASYIYIKVGGSWKRSALSTF